MRWFTKHLRNVGIASVSMLFLLTCLALIPLSAASAHEGTAGVATPTTVTVQATPTEDATVTALNKEQLAQQVAEQQHTLDNWLWSNAATILSSFLSTLVIVIGALFGLWRWRADRKDAQDKELKDRENEREKRAEERFQKAVEGLGNEREEARVGATILLRTFLQQGYEQFYRQTFDLAVANLRLPRTSEPPEDPHASRSLTTLSQALIVVFKEAFPLARGNPQPLEGLIALVEEGVVRPLDATGVLLDNAYLVGGDLEQVWMPGAFLREAHLWKARLSQANLSGANLSRANLREANLTQANLTQANLSQANLSEVDLSQADLSGVDLSRANLWEANLSGACLRKANLYSAEFAFANLSRADLTEANLSNVTFLSTELVRSLTGTNLRGVKGLTKERLAACKAKGAIIDE
jgi:uncharacterized protein YjbI with pentapeptide repeats